MSPPLSHQRRACDDAATAAMTSRSFSGCAFFSAVWERERGEEEFLAWSLCSRGFFLFFGAMANGVYVLPCLGDFLMTSLLYLNMWEDYCHKILWVMYLSCTCESCWFCKLHYLLLNNLFVKNILELFFSHLEFAEILASTKPIIIKQSSSISVFVYYNKKIHFHFIGEFWFYVQFLLVSILFLRFFNDIVG